MKRLPAILFVVLMSFSLWAKTDKQTVVFDVDIHCQGCIDKIQKNIAFEKGVKDLRCDLKSKTVVVVFDASKTDVPTLQKAFAKIGKHATPRAFDTDTTGL
ncbi:MAG: cation transporter [Paludibacteraceae bacterium]|nr:cation transporter [Paludibacteraceae bacterium]